MWLIAGGTATGQTMHSATPAQRLMKLLSDRKMAHVAVADPREPGRYVAAALISMPSNATADEAVASMTMSNRTGACATRR